MNPIQFTTTIGPDGTIQLPPGLKLPEGFLEISIRPTFAESFETRGRDLATKRGLNWEMLTSAARSILIDDLVHEDRGTARPIPPPGAFKGSILYMAPDFDAPLDDLREYME